MIARRPLVPLALLALALAASAQVVPGWRYYRPGNTGIQGDYCEAIWIGPDGDPWIGGYDASFEEGGVSRFVQAENRWVNVSNVDWPVIGHPDLTGTTRVTDIEQDAQGRLWMATWRGALRMDPQAGPSSLVNYAGASTALKNGGARDLAIAPDGTVWFALIGYGGAMGGVLRHTPSTGAWKFWTGGNPPTGGNNWPVLVWSVRGLGVVPKAGGAYEVWADADNGSSVVWWDSVTQQWTFLDFSYTPGSILDLAGKNAADAQGNLWAVRFKQFNGGTAVFSLDYRRADGTWVVPPQAPGLSGGSSLGAFRAFGDRQALAADGSGRVWRFNGTAWSDLGVWQAGAWTYALNLDAAGTVWASGVGGAARRDPVTGQWQRYRVTNTSQYDSFNNDLSLDPATGRVWACANAGPGAGGMTMFDGQRWTGFNNLQYGLGVPWPFPTDNSTVVGYRPSLDAVVVNPMYNGIRQWDGLAWSNLNGMSESRGLVEDSLGRLWSLGNYFSLRYLDGAKWVTVPNNGAWGNNIQVDRSRAGTVWASTYAEVIRTDGHYRWSRTYGQFPELNIQSDIFNTVAAGPDGTAWLGSTQGMFRLDAEAGSYEYFTSLGGIDCTAASPWAVTPDGRVWFAVWDIYGGGPHGLAWWDGANAGLYSAPKEGQPQWGGLPHAQIAALQVRELDGGYELWMSCKSRGLAVLTVALAFKDLGAGKPGVAGVPQLSGSGPLTAGSTSTLALSGAAPSAAATLVAGLSELHAPFKGGTLVPSPDVLVPLVTDASGALSLSFTWPAGVPAGTQLALQAWVQDAAASAGLSASNALRATGG